jgi:hypothetical protein
MDERVDEIGEKYNYMFPSIPKRDMNRYLKDILKKLGQTKPSLMELYPTALSCAELRKEKLYQEMNRKVAKILKTALKTQHCLCPLSRDWFNGGNSNEMNSISL